MKLLLLFDKLVNKIINKYRSLIFYVKTKQRVNFNVKNTNIKIGDCFMFNGHGDSKLEDNVKLLWNGNHYCFVTKKIIMKKYTINYCLAVVQCK